MSNQGEKRRVYTAKFKREAIELSKSSGKPRTALEQELGLSQGFKYIGEKQGNCFSPIKSVKGAQN